jgi:hypothetical protein
VIMVTKPVNFGGPSRAGDLTTLPPAPEAVQEKTA